MRHSISSLLVALLAAGALPAGEIRHTVVSPAGVFDQIASVPDIAPPSTPGRALFSSGNPNPSGSGLRWVYPNPAGMPWITESVAVGNGGTFHWLGQDLNFRRISLVASTDDQSPALPIWEDALPNATLASVEVAAPEHTSSAVAVYFDLLGGNHEIRAYSAFAPTPLTLPTSDAQEVSVSDDGQVIAIGYRDANGFAAATIYDAQLNPKLTVTATGAPVNFAEHDLSADGSTLLLASLTTDFVFDASTGALLFQDSSTVGHQAHVIDGDGDTWGRGGFDVGLWKRIGATWQRILAFDDPTLINSSAYTACDLSKDGSTFVVAAVDAANWLDFRVYCWSVGASSTTLLWTYQSIGAGAWQDTPQKVALSDDGRTIVVGSWGAQQNGHPEVLVFDRDQGPVPIAGLDTPGSVFDVDVSGDGRVIAAGTKSIHANVNGNGGEGYSFDLGGQGLWLTGTPSIGRAIGLHFGGAPGDAVLLLGSLGLLPAPIPVSGVRGGLWLDPALLFLPPTPVGTIPAAAELTLPLVVPAIPAAVGISAHLQSVRTGAGTALDNPLSLPITP